MELLAFSGSPYAMGLAFGSRCRDEIQKLYRARLHNAVLEAEVYGGRTVTEAELLKVARRSLSLAESYHPDGCRELEGIARGSELSLPQIWAMNALTDLRDFAAFAPELRMGSDRAPDGEGCSSIVVSSSHSKSARTLLGQTWDLRTDNMPFVRMLRRRPEKGPETLVITTVGCLSLIGLNDEGLTLGTTNLRTIDTRVGVGYLDVIHRALASTSFEAARAAIVEAPRMGGHYYYLADRSGRISTFECSAERVFEVEVSTGFRVQCNHATAPEIRALEPPGTPLMSTHHRQRRLTELAEGCGRLAVEDLQSFFADTKGGELAINRKDYGGISSNASVVIEPATRRLWAVHGPADQGTWRAERLSST